MKNIVDPRLLLVERDAGKAEMGLVRHGFLRSIRQAGGFRTRDHSPRRAQWLCGLGGGGGLTYATRAEADVSQRPLDPSVARMRILSGRLKAKRGILQMAL